MKKFWNLCFTLKDYIICDQDNCIKLGKRKPVTLNYRSQTVWTQIYLSRFNCAHKSFSSFCNLRQDIKQ